MPKLLLVDDDVALLRNMSDWLVSQGFTVETAPDGIAAGMLLRSVQYDVIVVDWQMPGQTGPEMTKEFREAQGDTPIIMLTAKNAIEEKEKGYISGVDDYLTKPFHPKELLLRIKSLLGRRVQTNKNIYQFGPLTLDLNKNSVLLVSQQIKLTGKEYALMEFFIRHPEQCFTVDALISRVWKSDEPVTDQAVRVCIARLRQKLESYNSSANIVAETGFGYKLSTAACERVAEKTTPC